MLCLSIKKFTYNEDHRTLTSEASDLGFPIRIGMWPESVMVFNSDNGVEAEFFKKKTISFRGEIVGMEYYNASTKTLRIYND